MGVLIRNANNFYTPPYSEAAKINILQSKKSPTLKHLKSIIWQSQVTSCSEESYLELGSKVFYSQVTGKGFFFFFFWEQ